MPLSRCYSMKTTKGQASIEYLTTYGWAIFALLIVLAVIFSSGILSPSYLISEECSFSNNLPCQASLYNTAGHGTISLRFFNPFPYKVKLVNFSLSSADGLSSFSGFDHDLEIESGSNYTYTGTYPTSFEINSIKRFGGNLSYVSCAPEVNETGCGDSVHLISGRVVGRVVG